MLRQGTTGALLVWSDLAKSPTCNHPPRALRASLRAIASPRPGTRPLSLRALCQLALALGRAWQRHGPSCFDTMERTLLVDALDALGYRAFLDHLDGTPSKGRRDRTPANLCQLLEVHA